MRLVTYEIEHKSGLGVISRDGSWVYPLASLDMDYKTMQELIETISDSEKQLLEYASGQDPYKVRGAAPIGEVSLLAPIPHPRQDVICLGINYMAHAEESARFKKEAFDGERPYAVYFSKRVNRATDPGAGIPSHRDIVTDLDYEAELAVIIGREASHVREEEVKDYIKLNKADDLSYLTLIKLQLAFHANKYNPMEDLQNFLFSRAKNIIATGEEKSYNDVRYLLRLYYSNRT